MTRTHNRIILYRFQEASRPGHCCRGSGRRLDFIGGRSSAGVTWVLLDLAHSGRDRFMAVQHAAYHVAPSAEDKK